MFRWFKTWRRDRSSRAFMVREARRFLSETGIAEEAKLNDKAVLALCVSFGTAYLQGLAIAKKMNDGTVRLVTDLNKLPALDRRLDG